MADDTLRRSHRRSAPDAQPGWGAPPMTPGTYLRKRRIAADTSLLGLARLSLALRPLPASQRRRPPGLLACTSLIVRLRAAERDLLFYTLPEVERLAALIPLSPMIYEQLVDLHLAGPDSGLPEPHLCRSCGCSFLDPCIDAESGAVCSWASLDPGRCTFCTALLTGLGPNERAERELLA